MEHFDASLSTYFKAFLGPRDTRVKGWFLLDNYIPTFVCSVIYLLIVWLGPKYMKNRQPFSCRGILQLYNLGLTLLSLYMFYEVGQCVGRQIQLFLPGNTQRGRIRYEDHPRPLVVLLLQTHRIHGHLFLHPSQEQPPDHRAPCLPPRYHAQHLVVCDELGSLRPFIFWCDTQQLHPCPHVLVLWSVLHPVHASLPLVEKVHHSRAAGPVCADNHPDDLRGLLAMLLPSRVAVLPDWIHDFPDCSLHKLLHSDLQQERGLSEERTPEGPPERVCGRRQRTHQQLPFPGKQREAQEAAKGLTSRAEASRPRRVIVSTA
ncbi:ELOVL family member 5, elongation of long chain fatty acids (yeast), isoform CRA_b [Mus musculus]|nr:ELOVL family member 5, elongation of long chain fatty acids (yeast), isoform CRA_b [Mus musculus]